MSVRREQPVRALTARPVGLAQQQPLGTALGAAPRRSIPALWSSARAAALEADSWSGLLALMQGCYPRRVALMSGAERHPRSRTLSVSRFLEITRAIVDAQSQKCRRGAWSAV
jgi:hypothetical protein